MTPNNNIPTDFAALLAAPTAPEALFPELPERCTIYVATLPAQYSASAVARAIEDCDAHLLNLNVTSLTLPTGEVVVRLDTALRNTDPAVRALERYGYRVIHTEGGISPETDTLTERINHLLSLI